MFYFKFRMSPMADVVLTPGLDNTAQGGESRIRNTRYAWVVCIIFVLTIIGMVMRQYLGVMLGYIAFSGTVLLILVLELFGKAWRLDPPDLGVMLSELDWKAIGFYVALFALVGGLESADVLGLVADSFVPYIESSLLTGVSILFWVTALIVGVVEHDAYILSMLYVIRDLAEANDINPWPLYWALVWAGTLGSNLTIAGAPALYVALTMGEKEDGKKWSLKKFLSFSVPYVIVSLVVSYILMVLIWVMPFIE